MGYNFTGITIDKNFEKDPEKVIKFLGMPLFFEKEIDFETGSGYKDGDYFDIFFSDKGTTIYTHEPLLNDAEISKYCSILSYTVSETSMAFFMSLDINRMRVREVIDHEGNISDNIGKPMDVEEGEHLMEAIIKQKEKMFGMNFYQMPLDYKGYRYKLANITEEDIHKAPFYMSDSMASNPGRISVNFIQWTKMNFAGVAKRTLMLVGSLILMLKVHWLFAIVFIGFLLYNIWHWLYPYNLYKAGDVNPGKVISINPNRIAVATNLTKMGGNYPVLRIVEVPLPKFEQKVGDFIPTVGLYHDNPYGYPFWAEFNPIPVSHGTTDKGILRARFETFSKEDFSTLNRYIADVATREVGTYKIDKESSGWKDFPDVVVGELSKMKGPEK